MLSYNIYYNQIQSVAKEVVMEALDQCDNDSEQAMELINDSLLHEYIDGHEWVIYNAYHLPILQHSSNADYMVDNLGEDYAASELKERGLSGLHCALAFWAMYADITDILSDTLEDIIDTLDSN